MIQDQDPAVQARQDAGWRSWGDIVGCTVRTLWPVSTNVGAHWPKGTLNRVVTSCGHLVAEDTGEVHMNSGWHPLSFKLIKGNGDTA